MSSKTLVFKSSDNQIFEVDASVISISQTIKNLIDDDCAHETIPLLEVTGDVFAMVIEYCKKHTEPSTVDDNKDVDSVDVESNQPPLICGGMDWDAEFVAKLDMPALFKLIQAANFLNIESLLELVANTIADLIKDMMPEEVRKIFNIESDFTKEEEEKHRAENEWAYEV